jgi:type VII secretion-associated serine protease mycosin
MRNSFLRIFTLSLFITGCSAINQQIIPIEPITTTNNNSDEIIVKLITSVNPENYARKNNLELVSAIGLNMYIFKGKTNISVLKNSSEIKWIESNSPINLPRLNSQPMPEIQHRDDNSWPNDPFLEVQYGIKITGTDKVWKVQKGNPGVIVAVIDSGVDGTHPEFQGQLSDGFDFTVKPPVPGGNIDKYGHGTHVAGVIGAKANNGIGISGMAPNCKILPVRIFDEFGHSSEGIAAEAIIWSVDHGAKVINASWGSPIPGQAQHDAVKYALDKDVVFVAAVGNSGNDDPDNVSYPGASPGVIGVSATTDIDTWASFSTYGPQVDLAAPGKAILSTYPLSLGNGYRIMEGTSMASPAVAAAAALVRSQFPQLTQQQVAEKLQSTAKDVISTGHDPYAGYGRIDVARAVLE